MDSNTQVKTEKYVKKPLYVTAVRVNARNFDDVVEWCQGEVEYEELQGKKGTAKKFIRVRVNNPRIPRQTKAFIDDWILYTDRGYKVYTNKAFSNAFDAVGEEPVSYPYEDGDVIVLGPECFVTRDGATLSWKGVNFVPQKYNDTRPSDVPDPPDKNYEEHAGDVPSSVQLESPVEEGATTPQGEPIELVEATPEAIAEAVRENEQARIEEETVPESQDSPGIIPVHPEHLADAPSGSPVRPGPISEQPPEDAAAGKRVLSEKEQRELPAEEVRDLLASGEVVLAQDLAETA
jgi:hypothetical protein